MDPADIPYDHMPVGMTLSSASTTAIISPVELEMSQRRSGSPTPSNMSAATTVISAASMPAVITFKQEWISTRMGILVSLQILFGIVSIVCAATPPDYHPPYRSFFLALSGTALILSAAWFCLHITNCHNVFNWPWITLDLVLSLFCQFAYTVAFIVILVLAGQLKNHVAAGVFGAFVSILYGISAFIAFKRLRAAGDPED